jgi:hypothetical protein
VSGSRAEQHPHTIVYISQLLPRYGILPFASQRPVKSQAQNNLLFVKAARALYLDDCEARHVPLPTLCRMLSEQPKGGWFQALKPWTVLLLLSSGLELKNGVEAGVGLASGRTGFCARVSVREDLPRDRTNDHWRIFATGTIGLGR